MSDVKPKLAFRHGNAVTTFVSLREAEQDGELVLHQGEHVTTIRFALCRKSKSLIAVTVFTGRKLKADRRTAKGER